MRRGLLRSTSPPSTRRRARSDPRHPRLPVVLVRLARVPADAARAPARRARRPARASACRSSPTCGTRSGSTPTPSKPWSTPPRSTSVALVTHDMGDTVGGELLARDLEGALVLRRERACADQRVDLHRHGAAHQRPAVPARRARRACSTPAGVATAPRSRRRSPRSARRRPSTGGRRPRRAVGVHVAQRRRAPAGAHHSLHRGPPRRGGALHRRDRDSTRRRSASCGARSIPSPSTR